MASWNSIPLEITYEVLGWVAFLSWTVGAYPQIVLNFRRKSVVGLNFDFVVLNWTKQSAYLIYNASLYFSTAVQKQYLEKYGKEQMIPVAANDVAFSIHAVLMTAVTLCQIAIYERGNQKVSKISFGIVAAVWLGAAVCVFLALPTHSWLWLISIFNSIQVFMTVIKYIPQASMNFLRKSTDGFSIGNILLDFSGGVANYAQMAVQSIDQGFSSKSYCLEEPLRFVKEEKAVSCEVAMASSSGSNSAGSWVNFYGNMGKTLLSLISIFFDLIFMNQHFVLYRGKRASIAPKIISKESTEPLIKSSDDPVSENV